MKNTVSHKMAVLLKEAGFPQPEFEVGQFWYAEMEYKGGTLEHVPLCVVVEQYATRQKHLRRLTCEKNTGEKGGEPQCFAPVATDILALLCPDRTTGQMGADDVLRMALDPEKAAAQFLALLKKPQTHSLYDEWLAQMDFAWTGTDNGIVMFARKQCFASRKGEAVAEVVPVHKNDDIGLGPGVGGLVTLIKLPGSKTVIASLDVSSRATP